MAGARKSEIIEQQDTQPKIQPSSRPLLSPAHLTLLYLSVVIIVAFGFRVAGLNELPRSLSLDEAVDGLDALQLIRLRWLTPFLQNNFGRETLFFYLQGLGLQLYGISIFSLRFCSAIAGTLTIPLVYIVGQRLALGNLLPGDGGRRPAAGPAPPKGGSVEGVGSRFISLLAATGLAVAYWHLYFSRVALRAILLPPLLLALIWCFWRGWYSPPLQGEGIRRRWLILAGFLLGLTGYTYLAARLLPLLFILFFMAELLRDNSNRFRRWVDFSLFMGTAAIVSAPLLLYFQQHPQALGSRTQALSIFADSAPGEILWSNLLALLQLHFLGGTWLGQWPALNLLSAAGFLLGLPVCLYHFKKPAGLFLLLWWVTGVAPVLFSHQDWEATTTPLRGIIAWPALFLISALGLITAIQPVSRWARPKIIIHNSQFPIRLFPLLLLLLFGGLTSAYHYFYVWATTYNDFSDHPAAIAHYLNRQTEQLTLTPLKFYGESVTNFLLQARYPRLANIDGDTLRTLLSLRSTEGEIGESRPAVYLLPHESTAESVFVLLEPAPGGDGTAYLLPPLTPAQIQALSNYTRHTTPLATILDSEWEPVSQIYPLTGDAPFLPASTPVARTGKRPVRASFNDEILLTNYRVEPAIVQPGDTVTLHLDWQARRPLDGDYYLFVHLVNIAQGQRYGQVNTPLTGVLFNAHRWPVGLAVPDLHYFTLPAGAPDGAYLFEVGLYHPASGQRWPVTGTLPYPPAGGDNARSAGQVRLGKFQVQRRPPAAPRYPLAHTQFEDGLALLGVDAPATRLRPGQSLTYTLHWQALAPPTKNYTVFTHLLNAAGELKAQQDNPPQQGRYPTSWWDPGEIILDPYALSLSPDLAPGDYSLRVGLYEPETGRRLPLQNGGPDFVDWPNFIKLED